jgi:hypothetical protein
MPLSFAGTLPVPPSGHALPSGWDGYPLPLHRLLPGYSPPLGARPYDLPTAAAPYFRES